MNRIVGPKEGCEFADRLIAAFGLEKQQHVFAFTLTMKVNEPLTVSISKYVKSEELDQLVAVVEEYKFKAVT